MHGQALLATALTLNLSSSPRVSTAPQLYLVHRSRPSTVSWRNFSSKLSPHPTQIPRDDDGKPRPPKIPGKLDLGRTPTMATSEGNKDSPPPRGDVPAGQHSPPWERISIHGKEESPARARLRRQAEQEQERERKEVPFYWGS